MSGGNPRHPWSSHRAIIPLICGIWLLLGIVLLCTGPLLNSHETIVAQIARQTLQNGDWIVPRYLDAPFLVKPPLAPWLAAIAGFLLPPDRITGLPMSTAAARLPSLVATLMTILVLYALARSMYGRRVGLCTAFIYATSAGTMAFALNATAEALLTFFCTWAYAEFWWSRQAGGRTKRAHQVRFFIALGLAMMAKAPMPLMLLAVPLAVWWWTERSTRLLAVRGLRATPAAVRLFGRGSLGRLRLAATDLGLWWGIPVAGAFLVAWMWAVSRQIPYIWRLWHSEYFDRLHDQELWVATHGSWYYLPILLGLTAPWLLSLPEALASPFLKRYQKYRRPNFYAWYWVITSVVVLSIMHFKQDYYLLPVLPACALLLGPVLYDLFIAPSPPPTRAIARRATFLLLFILLVVPVACFLAFRDELSGKDLGSAFVLFSLLAAVFVVGGILFAARLFIKGRKPLAFCTVGLTSLAVFTLVWVAAGSDPQRLREYTALINGLHQAGVGDNANVYWADSVPDGRITFYGVHRIQQLGDPFEMRAGLRGQDKTNAMLEIGSQICTMLEGERVYVVFKRKRYDMLRAIFKPKANVLFEVDRMPHGPDGDDWVVVTNQ